ncbi:uncharacterized protein LOC101745053 [Bombyx mori]|uniref:N-acetyltransferase domain-containing protein n=1 Tax=Bombyx mori TaxID=7091 RepID=A0A8R2DN84_BOMMO|nr:uncharacterized protein LOC101745053 [Bombyx mori]
MFSPHGSEEWLKFSKIRKDGTILNFSIQTLPENRFDEFMDFKIKYYVQQEAIHVASGIANNERALEDYRQVYTKLLKHPSIKIVICCLEKDNDQSEIVGFSIVKLLKIGEKQNEVVIEPKTELMRRFLEIFERLEKIFVVSDLMKQYNIDSYLDDEGLATHPDYRSYGIAQALIKIRIMLCKTYGVPMTGGWVTSRGTDIAATRQGCVKVFEISQEELGKKLGIELPDNEVTHYKYYIVSPSSEKNVCKL